MGTPVKIIIDTDIDTDCDDAGALAVANNLHNGGSVELAGVVCSIPVEWCAICAKAINSYYGNKNIPVGSIQIPGWENDPRYAEYKFHRNNATQKGTRRLYNEVIGSGWGNKLAQSKEEATQLYRRLLSSQPDKSVSICAIGSLTVLACLLDSKADNVSSLTGKELVSRKVRQLVSMAEADFPSGKDCFNWAIDLDSAVKVLDEWPGQLVVSRHGNNVMTGKRFMASVPAENPVSIAYRTLLGSADAERPSWDQLAVLYTAGLADDLFEIKCGYSIVLDPRTGEHKFDPRKPASPDRAYLHPIASPQEMARKVEDKMIG